MNKEKSIEEMKAELEKKIKIREAELAEEDEKLRKELAAKVAEDDYESDGANYYKIDSDSDIDLSNKKYKYFHEAIIAKQNGGTSVALTLAKYSLTIKDFGYIE